MQAYREFYIRIVSIKVLSEFGNILARQFVPIHILQARAFLYYASYPSGAASIRRGSFFVDIKRDCHVDSPDYIRD